MILNIPPSSLLKVGRAQGVCYLAFIGALILLAATASSELDASEGVREALDTAVKQFPESLLSTDYQIRSNVENSPIRVLPSQAFSPESEGISALNDRFGNSVSISGSRAAVAGIRIGEKGAVVVYSKNNGIWEEESVIFHTEGNEADFFGHSVHILNERLVVGAPLHDQNGRNSGAVYIFEFDSGSWYQVAKLLPNDGALEEFFGVAVTANEDTIFVGASAGSENNASSGSFYVFELQGSSWIETSKISPSEAIQEARFGRALALSGNNLLVGAPNDEVSSVRCGAAYVFGHEAGNWKQMKKLAPSNCADGDQFGYSLGVDGKLIVVGAPKDRLGIDNPGSAYFFRFENGEWLEYSQVFASDSPTWDGFGFSVAVAENRALIGAYGNEVNGHDSGSVFVFEARDGEWQMTTKLNPPDGFANSNSLFGVSVSADSEHFLIGASRENVFGNIEGAVYIYPDDQGQAREPVKLFLARSTLSNRFGTRVALHGNRALVSAPGAFNNPGEGKGIVYVYQYSSGFWERTAELKPAGLASTDRFGSSLALYGDWAVVGAPGSDRQIDGNGNVLSVGSVYIYKFTGEAWVLFDELIPSDGHYLSAFGSALDIANDRILIGAPLQSTTDVQDGAAYVFNFLQGSWRETQKITASDAQFVDLFGSDVSLHGDRAVISTPGRGFNDGEDGSGVVHVFDLQADGVWLEMQIILPAQPNIHESFGSSVSLDQDLLLVSSERLDEVEDRVGIGHLFTFNNDQWNEVEILEPSGQGSIDQRFLSVGASLQDGVAMVSLSHLDSDERIYSLFRQTDHSWYELAQLSAFSEDGHSNSPTLPAFDGNLLLLGLPGYDEHFPDSGRVYFYQIPLLLFQDRFEAVEIGTEEFGTDIE